MRIFFAAAVAVLVMSGQALAETCPVPGDIAQRANATGGFLYAAQGNWRGENPTAVEGDLKSLRFVNAKITDKSVICRYEGGTEAFLSLSRPTTATPAGSAWKDGACEGDAASCSFN
ncbi:hypothetical protein N7650_18200 [Pseudomonas sp. GD04058]|uniref:hypothetical protein n=1 Tax=Pseudomonas sp. GD04058 TaxID=2975429 RepID=UPI00244B3715|nr:hypothetical protein [Pseudomonas sp. GD04058]MDG9884770.1 hypothetical protein [Pseudomonas sp. GD04058]